MPPPTLTPAQLALQAERRALKQAKKEAAQALAKENGTAPVVITDAERSRYLNRSWVGVKGKKVDDRESRKVWLVTWNILAQTLVRRELFPGSDCLRWSDRRPMLLAELANYGTTSDIVCLQECDRLSDLAPALPSHEYVSTKGRNKLHGLVIFYRSSRFRLRGQRTVYLDEEELSPISSGSNGSSSRSLASNGGEAEGRRSRGGSRQTKNVGLLAAFEEVEQGGSEEEEAGGRKTGKGLVVATTHLFWHPRFAYERVRQTVILLRALRAFRKDHDCLAWPAVLAGDLNIQPYEATYQLLTAPDVPLHPLTIDQINSSRLVHTSVDKITPPAQPTSTPASETPDKNGSSSDVVEGTGDTQTEITGATGTNTPAEKEDDHQDEDGEGDGEGEGGEPDSNEKSIANTRPPQPADGIPKVDELVNMFKAALPGGRGLTSAYGSALPSLDLASGLNPSLASSSAVAAGAEPGNVDGGSRPSEVRVQTFGSRGGLEPLDGSGEGGDEPGYTCYTPLFKLTLDYLFLLGAEPTSQTDSTDTRVTAATLPSIVELLRPAHTSELGDGLPKKGISASDHLAVGVGLDL